jgi:hypothetical protein
MVSFSLSFFCFAGCDGSAERSGGLRPGRIAAVCGQGKFERSLQKNI